MVVDDEEGIRDVIAEALRARVTTAVDAADDRADEQVRPGRFAALLWQLRRRRVYRVAVGHAAMSFLALQSVELPLPAMPFGEWFYPALAGLVLAGFPVALLPGWVFDITENGVRRATTALDDVPGSRRMRADSAGSNAEGAGAAASAVPGMRARSSPSVGRRSRRG